MSLLLEGDNIYLIFNLDIDEDLGFYSYERLVTYYKGRGIMTIRSINIEDAEIVDL